MAVPVSARPGLVHPCSDATTAYPIFQGRFLKPALRNRFFVCCSPIIMSLLMIDQNKKQKNEKN